MGLRDGQGMVGTGVPPVQDGVVAVPCTGQNSDKTNDQGRPSRGSATTQGNSLIHNLIREATAHSLWPLMLGLDYTTLELFSAIGPRYDLARIGSEVFRPSPRQVDLMLVAGVVNRKMAPLIRQLWEAMAEPRFVIAVGAGAISGAPFGSNYAVDGGVDKIVPVDIYIPGDPPRPEQIIGGIEALAARISSGEVAL